MATTVTLLLLLLFMAIRVPVVWAMLLPSCFYFIFFSDIPLVSLAHRMYGGMQSFPLLAIPLFILAAEIMNRGKITSKIFDFASNCVGHIPGSLGHVNVLTAMIFAGMSGSEIADLAGPGKIGIKAMTDRGFKLEFSAAIVGAASIIGPIVPPSILMIIYGSIAEQSVGRLFLGGFVPGVLVGIFLMVTVYIIAKRENFPIFPFPGVKVLVVSFLEALPAILIPVFIIGGIMTGIFTPTEAAVIAVVYAFILTFVIYRDVPIKEIVPILYEVALTTGLVTIIVGAAAVFGWVITLENIPDMVQGYLIGYTNEKWIILLIFNVILLIEGCFFSVIAIMLIMTPMMLPIAKSFGIDLVHLGIVMTINLCVGYLTPPFGIGLFVLSDMTGLSVGKIAKALIPFFIPILIVLFLVTYIPQLALYIPDLLMGKAVTH